MSEGGIEWKPKKPATSEAPSDVPTKNRRKGIPEPVQKPNPIDTLAAKLRATKSQEWNESLKIIPMTLKKDFAVTADADSDPDKAAPDSL